MWQNGVLVDCSGVFLVVDFGGFSKFSNCFSQNSAPSLVLETVLCNKKASWLINANIPLLQGILG